MQEKYFLQEKQNHLTNLKYQEDVFFTLLKHKNIDLLKQQNDFLILTNAIKAKLIAKDVFGKVAVPAILNNKMQTMQFLIEDCGLKDLVKIEDEEKKTLLHLAAIHSGKELFEFLLRKGADPNAADINGEVPLHAIAKESNKALFVGMLRSYNAKIDVINNDGYTPLLLAALFQHSETISQLKKHGANAKFKKDGNTYIEFLVKVRKGEIQASLDVYPSRSQNGTEDRLTKHLAQFYLGYLYPTCNKQIFQEFLKLIESDIASPLPDYMRKPIADACMFTFSMDFKNINNFLLEYFKKNKLVLNDLVLLILRVCLIFINQNDYYSAAETAKFLYSILTDMAEKSHSMMVYFNELCFIFNKVGLHSFAELVGNQGLACETDEKDNRIEAFLYYNIGIAKKSFLLYEEALEKFTKAMELLPNDSDIIEALLTILMLMGKFKRVKAICQNFKVLGEYPRLVTLHAKLQLGEVGVKEVLIETQNNFTERSSQIYALNLQNQCYLQRSDFDKALEAGRKSFELSVKDDIEYDIGEAIVKMLKLYLESGQYVHGLTFLQEQISRYPMQFQIEPMLMSFAIAMYTANHRIQEAEKMIEKLLCTQFEKKVLSKLYVLLAIDNINHAIPDYQNAERYLGLALTLDPHSLGAILYKPLVAILANNKIQYETVRTEVDTELLTHIAIENDLLKEKSVEPELVMDEYDPVKIHAFFQAKKKEELSSFFKVASKSHETSQWWINEISYDTETAGLVSLNSSFYPAYYAMIKPDVNVDKETLQCFQMALEKGICSRKYQSNGVKFLKNCLIELKINEDKRLFTTSVYRNLEGKSLVIFDNVGNHKLIKRVLGDDKPICIISVLSVSPERFANANSQASFFNTKSLGKIPCSDNNVPESEIVRPK